MSAFFKIIGGMTGFAMGGPIGAAVGAAFGHVADNNARGAGILQASLQAMLRDAMTAASNSLAVANADPLAAQMRLAALIGKTEQVFALGVIALSARVAEADGPINQAEIDAFRRHIRFGPAEGPTIGRLFEQARDASTDVAVYATEIARAFAAKPGEREALLAILFGIARADGVANHAETAILTRIHAALALDTAAWDRARGAAAPRAAVGAPDPYAVLGIARSADGVMLRARWKQLMRDHHPDSLAGRGASSAEVSAAGLRVAAINAAWDQIKHERHL